MEGSTKTGETKTTQNQTARRSLNNLCKDKYCHSVQSIKIIYIGFVASTILECCFCQVFSSSVVFSMQFHQQFKLDILVSFWLFSNFLQWLLHRAVVFINTSSYYRMCSAVFFTLGGQRPPKIFAFSGISDVTRSSKE